MQVEYLEKCLRETNILLQVVFEEDLEDDLGFYASIRDQITGKVFCKEWGETLGQALANLSYKLYMEEPGKRD